MDSQRGQWKISPELEDEFRKLLLRVGINGPRDQETVEQLIRSPFVLELVMKLTAGNSLRAGQGHTPWNWAKQLWREPGLREDWQCETTCILARRLRAKEKNKDRECDLEKNFVGYWRDKVAYAAIKAAWGLYKERRSCGLSFGDGTEETIEEMSAADDQAEMEIRLDLAMLIDGLEDPRQRAVMRLSATQYNYSEIAAKLGISYEQVRYAVEQARKVLLKRLKQAA